MAEEYYDTPYVEDPAGVYAPPAARKSWVPTKKWFAALVGGVAAIAVQGILSGHFGDVEVHQLEALAVALGAAYWKNNDPVIAGVPEKS